MTNKAIPQRPLSLFEVIATKDALNDYTYINHHLYLIETERTHVIEQIGIILTMCNYSCKAFEDRAALHPNMTQTLSSLDSDKEQIIEYNEHINRINNALIKVQMCIQNNDIQKGDKEGRREKGNRLKMLWKNSELPLLLLVVRTASEAFQTFIEGIQAHIRAAHFSKEAVPCLDEFRIGDEPLVATD